MSGESDPSSFKSQLPGMVFFFATIIGTMHLAHRFEEPVMNWFSLKGGTPGDEPPWYFITDHFARGVCSLGALVVSLICAAVAWKKWPQSAGMMLWMPFLWHGGNIAESFIILHYCPGLLEGQRTTDRWPTFMSYLEDPLIESAHTTILIGTLVMAFALPLLFRLLRKPREEQPAPIAET